VAISFLAQDEYTSNDPETNVVMFPQAVDEILVDGLAKRFSDLLVLRDVDEQVDPEVELP
jgi:hypothetical protein